MLVVEPTDVEPMDTESELTVLKNTCCTTKKVEKEVPRTTRIN